MMGKDAAFVPGWDCHGLPIEWKIEEKYRKAGKNKDDVPIADFLGECRDFAAHWVGVQQQTFERLGTMGDWENAYKTMEFDSEAQIVREFHRFLMKGLVFKGSKPVMWSAVERTALAEAEVEYHDKISSTIWVKFPVKEGPEVLKEVDVVIYTTTPWTIPGNRAIAFSERVTYGLYEIKEVDEEALAKVGDKLALADSLAPKVADDAKITKLARIGDCPSLDGVICAHPLPAMAMTSLCRFCRAIMSLTKKEPVLSIQRRAMALKIMMLGENSASKCRIRLMRMASTMIMYRSLPEKS